MADPNKGSTTTVDHNHTPSEFAASDQDPPAPTTASEKEDPAAADPDCCHQTKRRKKCPESLDKILEFAPLNQSFSFTFDTKSTTCAPEITPKFGSFNSGKDSTPFIAKDQGYEIPERILEGKEESVGEGSEGREETEIVGVLIDNGIE